MEKNGLGLETELRLGLPGGGGGGVEKNEKKRVFSDFSGGEENKNPVVGWPPVCGYRRRNSFNGIKMYVKVSMDGAPFLRKIDLSSHKWMFIESCRRLRIMKRSDAKGIGLQAKDLLKGLAKEEVKN
ncbi:hypothetical protein DH2020_041360 [Rehmannia glutinosa]|uniref:Auxin-responsive protein n=1 Tax=Rehmannia glutinosa TaxID=99300 RepID=A0ABR0UQG8_REHGL